MVSGLTLKSLIYFVYFFMKFEKIVQFDYFGQALLDIKVCAIQESPPHPGFGRAFSCRE